MRRKVDLVILLFVLIAGVIGILNAQKIGDWVHSLRYDPPAEISQLAADAGMSDAGTNLFFRFSPQIVDQQTLTGVCDGEKLGCTEGQSIYILAPATESDKNRNIVTAAHEMLHVAYSRLSKKQVQQLESLLDTELEKYDAGSIKTQLDGYPKEDFHNEAHSFIGSQMRDLSPALETHFKQYFSDRTKSVEAFSGSAERYL